VLIEGLPRALHGELTAIVSQAAFNGERQVWQVVDRLEVTWQYGSDPERPAPWRSGRARRPE